MASWLLLALGMSCSSVVQGLWSGLQSSFWLALQAGKDSVFFDNDKNNNQLRSLVRYIAQLREANEKVGTYTDVGQQLKRLQLVESGIRISRAQLAGGKAQAAATMTLIRRMESFAQRDPVLPNFKFPGFLANVKLTIMVDTEFGLTAGGATEFVNCIAALGDHCDTQGKRFLRSLAGCAQVSVSFLPAHSWPVCVGVGPTGW